MSLKKSWEFVVQEVEDSLHLTDKEKANVIDKLDETIGSYLIEDYYPIEMGNLTPDEFAVYKSVLTSLNEGKFKKVSSEQEYNRAVKQILKTNPGKDVKKHLVAMDLAFRNDNWKEVNKHLKQISELL